MKGLKNPYKLTWNLGDMEFYLDGNKVKEASIKGYLILQKGYSLVQVLQILLMLSLMR